MKNRHIMLSLIVLLPILASSAVMAAHSRKVSRQPALIAVGDFRIAALPNWQRKVIERQPKHYHEVWQGQAHDYTIGYGKSVEFSQKTSVATIAVGFSVDRHANPVVQEVVVAGIKKYEEDVVKSRFANHVPGSVLKSEETTFRGHAAYLSQTRGPAPNGRDIIDSRTVTFSEGKNVYTVSETLTGYSLYQVETRAAEAWDALTRGISRTPGK